MRLLLPICVLALVAAPFTGRATARVSGAAEVVALQATPVADLVLLGGGFAADLREGMVCRVTRGTTAIAEVQLVGLRPNYAAALILSLAPGQSIHAGDLARIKINKT